MYRATTIFLLATTLLAIIVFIKLPSNHMYELHFQSGFNNESIDIYGINEDKLSIDAKTDYTISLADVIEFVHKDSAEIRISIPEHDIEHKIRLSIKSPYVLISLVEGNIEIEFTDAAPGYL